MKISIKAIAAGVCWWALPVLLPAQTAAAARAALPEAEQQILKAVQAQSSQFSDALAAAVKISSPTHDVTGVTKMGAHYRAQFDEMGLTTSWIAMPAEMKRAGHLIAEQKGTAGKRLLLIGHLDTVLPGGTFEVKGSRAKGSGATDDKGGNLIILEALRALKKVGALENRQLIVVLTGDEESIGEPLELARRDLLAAARRSDLALSFEAATANAVVVGRRGSSSWRLVAQGATGHSSGIFSPSLGDGAIYEAVRIVNSFRETLAQEKGLTFSPAMIVGGTEAEMNALTGTAGGKNNIVAQRAIVQGDLRFGSAAQFKQAKDVMTKIATQGNLRRTSATLEFHERYPAMEITPANLALMRQLGAISETLGYGPLVAGDPNTRGAGDVSFVAPLIPSIDGLGSRGRSPHAPEEDVDLASIPELVERTALLIFRLTR